MVFSINDFTPSAIKIFSNIEPFRLEVACYERLTELGVTKVLGHHIPQFFEADQDLLVIEMSIVEPPFLLDFASAYLDYPPDFSAEVLEEWQQAKREEFGERWGRVQVLLRVLEEEYGIFMLDVHPGNIAFGDE